MKIQKSITFNGCSFIELNLSVIVSCDAFSRWPSRKQKVSINCCKEV